MALAIIVALVIGVGTVVLIKHKATPQPTHRPPAPNAASGLPPVPEPAQVDRQVRNYIGQAELTFAAAHRSACESPRPAEHRQAPAEGSPDQATLSRFGVLKLPARAAGRFPSAAPYRSMRVFAKYVRVAQRRFGLTFEVFPVISDKFGLPARCVQLEASVLPAELRRAPSKIRAKALLIGNEVMRDEEYVAHHPEALCVFGGVGGGCFPFLYAQAQGDIQSTDDGWAWVNGEALYVYLVPDGVAKITARFPAGDPGTTQSPLPSRFERRLPSVTVTVRVINNLAVWKMANEPGGLHPTILWRAPNGRIIRTVQPN